MAEHHTIATLTLSAAEYAHLTSAARRAVAASLVAMVTAKGYRADDYAVECVVDHGAGLVTLQAHELDPLSRPLTFDDR